MIKKEGQVSRKILKEDRIAICPHFGCAHLEKVKPLKFGFLGFRKFPKCSKHKFPLVFVDEFVEGFLHAVNMCLFDTSSLPPEDLTSLIKIKAPDDLKIFINGWMYCNPIGRGAQIVSNYMDGLSRGYIKLLSRKQKKALQNEKRSKVRYQMLRKGLENIAEEYATFLQELRDKSETHYDPKKLRPPSDEVKKLLKMWLKGQLNEIYAANGKYKNESPTENEALPICKEKYDRILQVGTCTLLLGKSPAIITKGVSPFELFSGYHEFLKAGLCSELKREDMKSLLEENQEFLNIDGEDLLNIPKVEEEEFFSESDNMKDALAPKATDFEKNVMNEIRRIVPSLEATDNQKELILEKAGNILDKHILRAGRNEITIRSDANPSTNAAAIIYAVLVSNENMPKISGEKLSNMVGMFGSMVGILYNRWYKDLARRLDFNFKGAILGSVRNMIIGRYIHNGYFFLYMSKEYRHPELNPMGDRKLYRGEHIIVMEDYLSRMLTQKKLSRHPCLIKGDDGRDYIKIDCRVHHINHIRDDNKIENLHLYKSISEHQSTNINACLSGLIKLGQILFSNGNYYLNRNYDYRNLDYNQINEIIKPVEFVNYEDMNLVREAIKDMDWSGMEWYIEYKIRNRAPIERILLNPYKDCSKNNPLYRHRGWLKRILDDKRFNLTDKRLGELCGITENVARKRRGKHGISAEYWGFIRRTGLNSSGKRIIFIKVPKSYGNPFATKKANSDEIREHRYIMEQHLAREPELNQRFLLSGKYLKPKCSVHHINLDKLDNNLKNFWLCENSSEHNKVHASLFHLINELLRLGLMVFDNGKYFLARS